MLAGSVPQERPYRPAAAKDYACSVDDPFAILGLPLSFDVDPARIQRAYLAKANAVHPDVAGDDDAAAVQAAWLNRAKSTLLNPESRARAMLARLDGSASSDATLPAGFLAEMLETREEIDAAVTSGDASARARWQAWAQQRRAGHIDRLKPLFQQAFGGDAAVIKDIRLELNAWRYIERLIEQLDPSFRHTAPGALSEGSPA